MATIKTIGSSGQIALGKQFAGKHVLVEEIEDGVWLIKLGDFIPKNEKWLHHSEVKKNLDNALDWAGQTPAEESDLDDLEKRLDR